MIRRNSLIMAGLLMSTVFSGYAGVVTNWVGDDSFEALSAWSDPDATTNTSPWFSIGEGSNPGWVQREQTLVNSGSQTIKFTEWGNAQAVQQLGLTLDSNTVYELSFALRMDDLSANAALSNDTSVAAIFSTSPTLGGSYTWSQKSIYGQKPSTTGVWENVTLIIDGSDPLLADNHGEYLQLVLKKWNKSSEYTTFIDDVSFGEYVPAAAPANLLLGYCGSTGTNADVCAEGIKGNLFLGKAAEGGLDEDAGSNDGTFGTLSGASILASGYKVHMGNGTSTNNWVDVQIQNNTGSALQLDSFSFDYARWWVSGPQDITLSYAYGNLSGITNNTSIMSVYGVAAINGKYGDYSDFNVSLTNLVDQVLADGQKATFRLAASNAAGIWDKGAFDNIAIFGGPVTATGYEGWSIGYSLVEPPTGDDDGDGLSNIYEYGLNGDPTDELDQGTAPVFGVENVGGTNVFNYIHPQLSDPASGIAYSLALNTDLVSGDWMTNSGYVVMGTNVTGGDFDFVTNVTDTIDGKKFIKLIIE